LPSKMSELPIEAGFKVIDVAIVKLASLAGK
jgi:hypothetical protein